MPILQLLFWPLTVVYWIGLSIDRWARTRAQTRLPKPVISIGNLTVGGTGKTPLLLRLIDDLAAWKIRPAVLSRGYRGMARGAQQGKPNDEMLLLMDKHPGIAVGIGPNRTASAARLINDHPLDVFLLDDGFQHWSLARDLDIVCIDATASKDEMLLPAGRWREPLSALRRAQLAVITRSELVSPDALIALKKRVQDAIGDGAVIAATFHPHLVDAFRQTNRPWSWLEGKSVVALSGVGNPEAFEEGLKKAGAQVTSYRFPDHYAYDADDWGTVLSEATMEEAAVVTTEKDWVKLKTFVKPASSAVEVLVVRLDVRFPQHDDVIWQQVVKKALHEKS